MKEEKEMNSTMLMKSEITVARLAVAVALQVF